MISHTLGFNFARPAVARTNSAAAVLLAALACALLCFMAIPQASHAASEGPTPRIIGGVQVPNDPSTWPFIVAVYFPVNGDPSKVRQGCAGTLVAQQYVVTAAHCFNNSTPTHVMTGVKNLQAGTLIEIAASTIHPEFDRLSMYADIAVLKLATPAPSPAAPLRMATPADDPADNAWMFVAGWGRTVDGDTSSQSPDLLAAAQQSVNLNDCANTYSQVQGTVFYSQICGANFGSTTTVAQDTCQGDSGGPLYYSGAYGTSPSLIGVTSWGEGCAQYPYPGIYTRVSSYHDWVLQTISALAAQGNASQQADSGSPLVQPRLKARFTGHARPSGRRLVSRIKVSFKRPAGVGAAACFSRAGVLVSGRGFKSAFGTGAMRAHGHYCTAKVRVSLPRRAHGRRVELTVVFGGNEYAAKATATIRARVR